MAVTVPSLTASLTHLPYLKKKKKKKKRKEKSKHIQWLPFDLSSQTLFGDTSISSLWGERLKKFWSFNLHYGCNSGHAFMIHLPPTRHLHNKFISNTDDAQVTQVDPLSPFRTKTLTSIFPDATVIVLCRVQDRKTVKV